MAPGKQAGEYSLKSTSATYTPGPGGSTLVQVNFEGTASGFGAVLGTATFVGVNSGTWSWCAQAFLDDGERLTAIGQGTYESIARHKWSTRGFANISDGRVVRSEGEIDLASRTWTGRLFE